MAGGDKIAVLAVSQEGLYLAERLAAADSGFSVYAHAELDRDDHARFSRISVIVKELFPKVAGFVFIMASGIAVRTLGPLLIDKTRDPGGVVVDEAGDYVISLVGGHEGGANRLAYRVASILDAIPIITTGSDVKKPLTIGIGCRRGASRAAIVTAIHSALAEISAAIDDVGCLATIDAKRDEAGLTDAARSLDLPVLYISKERIVRGPRPTALSAAARRAFGIDGVCEPTALLARANQELLISKRVYGDVTIAIACRSTAFAGFNRPGELARDACASVDIGGPGAAAGLDHAKGSLALVGIGQGIENITFEAVRAIEDATDVIGYKTYIAAIEHLLDGSQTIHRFSMRQEVARAELAVELARAGKRVVVVSSGDAGIYGMAGPVLESLGRNGEGIDIRVVPGVTAAIAAAAALGAPLMNDFASISLSDLLTPWPEIERRLDAVAAADLVIALYNPKSRKRLTQLNDAVKIILRHRPAWTPVGIVREIGAAAEIKLTDLDNLSEAVVDMRSTLIIGNSKTAEIDGRLVTARGYRR